MSDVALFAGDRFYRSQFNTGQASYTVFQQDGVTYADPGFPGGTPYSGTVPNSVIQNAINALPAQGGSIILRLAKIAFTGPVTYTGAGGLIIRGDTPFMNRFYPALTTNPGGTVIVADGAFDAFQFGQVITPGIETNTIFLENLYITGKDPTGESYGSLSTTNGNGILLQNNIEFFLAKNVQIHRKQYGIQLAPGGGNEILNATFDTVALSYNQHGMYDTGGHVRNLYLRNIMGYVNQFTLLNLSPDYDLVLDKIDDEASGFNNTDASATCPLTLTATQDIHLRHVTLVSSKDTFSGPSEAQIRISFSDYAYADLEDILLTGAKYGGLRFEGSTNGYRFQARGVYIGKNPSVTNGYRGSIDNTQTAVYVQNAGNGTIIGGEIYGVTPFQNAGTGLVLCQGITNINHKGYAVTSPSVPATNVDQQNVNPFPVDIFITGTGSGITAYGITDFAGTLNSFTTTVNVGQKFTLSPLTKIRLTYTGSPTWKWYGL